MTLTVCVCRYVSINNKNVDIKIETPAKLSYYVPHKKVPPNDYKRAMKLLEKEDDQKKRAQQQKLRMYWEKKKNQINKNMMWKVKVQPFLCVRAFPLFYSLAHLLGIMVVVVILVYLLVLSLSHFVRILICCIHIFCATVVPFFSFFSRSWCIIFFALLFSRALLQL